MGTEMYSFLERLLTDLIAVDESRFLSQDVDGVEYRFLKTPPDSPGRYELELLRPGQEPGIAVRIEAEPDTELTPYGGRYYSTELRRMIEFELDDGRVVARDFLEPGPTVLTYLKPDLFGCDKGFLVFARYEDGQIRDFRFRSEGVDNYLFGSLFRKRWNSPR